MNNNLIDHNALSDLAYKKIKELIISNVMKPGDKIPQEKVAKTFGISKIPLIQALTMMSKEGILEKIPRRGFYVKKFNSDEIKDSLDIRILFENLGAVFLIDNWNEEYEKKLKEFLNRFEFYHKNKKQKEYYILDAEFHKFLIQSSNNKIVVNMNENLNILLVCFTKGMIIESRNSIEHHREIINSIFLKDRKKIEDSIRKHVNFVYQELIKDN